MSRRLLVPAIAAVLLVVALAGWWWRARPGGADAWPAGALDHGNVLLVTIDTLRADRLTSTAMPRLTALADGAHRFGTAYAHAPLTLPSHASILTGQLPPAHGVRGNGAFRLEDAQVTLAERLSAAGYRTGAFVGAFVLDARFGLAQGFDVYDDVGDERYVCRRLRVRRAAGASPCSSVPSAGSGRVTRPDPGSRGCTCSTRMRPTTRRNPPAFRPTTTRRTSWTAQLGAFSTACGPPAGWNGRSSSSTADHGEGRRPWRVHARPLCLRQHDACAARRGRARPR
ncbi:MAG: sulfatase-like hydrolase/transferase [Vicinamibacterales bacterium]